MFFYPSRVVYECVRSLDRELKTHLVLKRANFKVNHLSFCQVGKHVDHLSVGMTADMDDKKAQADFACMKLKLDVEQTLFKRHRLAVQEWEQTTANARAERLEAIDRLVEGATKEYCELRCDSILLEGKDEAA